MDIHVINNKIWHKVFGTVCMVLMTVAVLASCFHTDTAGKNHPAVMDVIVLQDDATVGLIEKDIEIITTYDRYATYDCLREHGYDREFFDEHMLAVVEYTHGGVVELEAVSDISVQNEKLVATVELYAPQDDTGAYHFSTVLLEIKKDSAWETITSAEVVYSMRSYE